MELHGRASALEIRVTSPLNAVRSNAVAAALSYEAELNKYGREVAKARDRLARGKVAQAKAAERLAMARARSLDPQAGRPSHMGWGGLGSGRGGEFDPRAEESEAEELLEAAKQATRDDQETLLACLRNQDQG